MARKDAAAAAAAAIKKSQSSSSTSSNPHSTSSSVTKPSTISASINEVTSAITTTYNDYFQTLTPRLKLIDLFLTFLVALGVLQFIYVLLIGNFPFNAFLGGFISCVGQFVLTVSLRLQVKDNGSGVRTEAENGEVTAEDEEVDDEEAVDEELITKTTEDESSVASDKIFKFVSPERSFGDFIFASLILHFIVIHFIN